MNVNIEELILFLEPLLPYLNLGMTMLCMNLFFRKVGFKVSLEEYKEKPLENLIWGLALILISSVVSMLIRAYLSSFNVLTVSLILFLLYLTLSQV